MLLKSFLSTNKKCEKKYKKFLFSGFAKFPPEIWQFLISWLESSISRDIIFFKVFFYYFLRLESFLLNFLVLGLESFVFQNIRKFHFLKYKKSFFWENIGHFSGRNIRIFFKGKILRADAGKCTRLLHSIMLKVPFWIGQKKCLSLKKLNIVL